MSLGTVTAGTDVAVVAVGRHEDVTGAVAALTERGRRVVLVSSGWTRPRLERALALGVRGCLVAGTDEPRLAAAVRAVAAGNVVISPELFELRREPARPPAAGAAARRAELLRTLSARERTVLALLGQGLSSAEVAERLAITPATVKSHVSHTLAKLGVRTRIEAVLMARDPRAAAPGRDPRPVRHRSPELPPTGPRYGVCGAP
ncbi:LuxR C-terminal-related transcriptional regulator [Streptomyces sp. SCA3-4]|uniref:helix-turn-helix transcriptional regulator n=1 Tax=Streptomyces sichuanensis TaxID=2871810 RepID=UPI001CE342BD|nr:LuxR C-terminal-related transcriptional regulator [Streptomyces sichuanensis]MCA6093733.1 LuxR C-terminal-related transcriptional regulator [Streptomyces sichuanensis]